MDDLITNIFSTFRVKSAVYFKETFCGSWGMKADAGQFAQFHVVTRGHCTLTSSVLSDPIQLETGDVVIFPEGASHEIRDKSVTACTPGADVINEILRGRNPFGTGEDNVTLICGHYEIDRDLSHPFFESLPGCLVIRSDEYQSQRQMGSILQVIIAELDQKKAGYELITIRLAEVLLITAIRHYYITQDVGKNFVKDEFVYKALNLMHQNLREEWTAEQLAKAVGISRTSLFSRFKAAIGQSPIKYLTDWKLIKAKQLLKETNLSISEICDQIGYLSKSSFIRAFGNKFKVSPLQYKKQVSNT